MVHRPPLCFLHWAWKAEGMVMENCFEGVFANIDTGIIGGRSVTGEGEFLLDEISVRG